MSTVLQRCLLRVLEGPVESAVFVDRLLLALFVHCAQDQDNARAIGNVQSCCSCEDAHSCLAGITANSTPCPAVLARFESELEKGPAMACLTVCNAFLPVEAALIYCHRYYGSEEIAFSK